MNNETTPPEKHSIVEKLLTPLGFLTGNPTNPGAVPFTTTAPKGLTHLLSAPSIPEADLTRQILRDAGFHVEYVPPVTTGIFGTSGSPHVYVPTDEEKEAREFLSEMIETTEEKE